MADPELRRIDSRTVYKNRWMTVREDRVRRLNGEDGLYGVVEKPDFSLIVPFDGEKFHLVQQHLGYSVRDGWRRHSGNRQCSR